MLPRRPTGASHPPSIPWLALAALVPVTISVAVVAAAWRRTAQPAVRAALLAVGAAAALCVWVFADTDYWVRDGTLLVRSGPFRWRIPIADIRAVQSSRNWLSSPALSLDRLAIRYGRGRTLLVSPRDRSGFVAALGVVNPALRASEPAR